LGNNFWRYIGHNFLRDLPDRFMGFGIFFWAYWQKKVEDFLQ
jgi:hypothetical protein